MLIDSETAILILVITVAITGMILTAFSRWGIERPKTK